LIEYPSAEEAGVLREIPGFFLKRAVIPKGDHFMLKWHVALLGVK